MLVTGSQTERTEFYRALVTEHFHGDTFVCPHCLTGQGMIYDQERWCCSGCSAGGFVESLAVVMGIDPEMRLGR